MLQANQDPDIRRTRQTMTVVDALSAIIEEGMPNEDLRKGFALLKNEEDVEASACLLLMHSRFSLFKELSGLHNLKF